VRRLEFAMIAVALLGLAGCGDPPEKAPDTGVMRVAQSEALQVEVRLSSDELTTAERAHLRITTAVAETHALDPWLEDFRSALEEVGWTVAWVEESAAPSIDVMERVRRTTELTLTPFLAGDYVIPALALTARPLEGGEAASLRAASIPVAVTSVLDEAEGEPDPSAAKGIVEPEESAGYAVWIGAGAIVLAVALVWLLVRRLRRRYESEEEIPAHEAALARVDDLMASGLLERGAMNAFYTELAHILRWWIERRYGLHAPERTSEEFLREASESRAMGERGLETVREFLTHADLVKFAQGAATAEQGSESAALVRSFIVGTAVAAERDGQSTGGAGRAYNTMAEERANGSLDRT